MGCAVSVEVHVSNGLPGFTIVGLPDAAVREARDRVRAAILSSGLSWPLRRVIVNLAPAAVMFGNHGATRAEGGGGRPRTGDGGRAQEGLWTCGCLNESAAKIECLLIGQCVTRYMHVEHVGTHNDMRTTQVVRAHESLEPLAWHSTQSGLQVSWQSLISADDQRSPFLVHAA